MQGKKQGVSRRDFLKISGSSVAAVGAASNLEASLIQQGPKKARIATVGTGSRGIGMWGAPVVRDYSDRVQFVGLCDINGKRVKVAQRLLGKSISDMDGDFTYRWNVRRHSFELQQIPL